MTSMSAAGRQRPVRFVRGRAAEVVEAVGEHADLDAAAVDAQSALVQGLLHLGRGGAAGADAGIGNPRFGSRRRVVEARQQGAALGGRGWLRGRVGALVNERFDGTAGVHRAGFREERAEGGRGRARQDARRGCRHGSEPDSRDGDAAVVCRGGDRKSGRKDLIAVNFGLHFAGHGGVRVRVVVGEGCCDGVHG